MTFHITNLFISPLSRSLRISTPLSDSACSSSTESSDGESASNYPLEPYGGEPIEILPGLFLGNAAHSEDITKIQKYNIRYILNVSTLPNVFEDTGKIEYLQIAITDHWSQDLSVHFPSAIKFIEEAKAKNVSCLIHCLAGVSRVSFDFSETFPSFLTVSMLLVCDDNTRLSNVRQRTRPQRRIHIRARPQTRRVAQLPLHGTTAHVRATAEKRSQPTTDTFHIIIEHPFKL